jgi:very-short-patch-repair endonuclease
MALFETAHAEWIAGHLEQRKGERRGRLERGHRHGETLFVRNVWWELVRSLDHVHPEYEVLDWRGRSYYADFAWLYGCVRLLIEIKGYNTHVKEMDRQKFCNEENRETFLHGMGYNLISFAYDDVEQRPELCMTLLRLVLSRYQASPPPVSRAVLAEKEIIRLAAQLGQFIRPIDVERHFEVDHRTAVLMLQKLCKKRWLNPVLSGKGERVVGYELIRGVLEHLT